MREIALWPSTNLSIPYIRALGMRRGFSPGAAARHSQSARVHADRNQPENPFSPRKIVLSLEKIGLSPKICVPFLSLLFLPLPSRLNPI